MTHALHRLELAPARLRDMAVQALGPVPAGRAGAARQGLGRTHVLS